MAWRIAIKSSKLKPCKKKMLTVGKFSKQKDLKIYETRLKEGIIQVNIPQS